MIPSEDTYIPDLTVTDNECRPKDLNRKFSRKLKGKIMKTKLCSAPFDGTSAQLPVSETAAGSHSDNHNFIATFLATSA